jgi:hypothetical protein|tara:strand:- start:8920 stop:9210 length:291 start_codon:yes stop_codon:yes gene_type:complete
MDKRKNNGGNSTKAKGLDKRKNEYRKALELAASPEDVVEVIKKLKEKAVDKSDVNAIKLFLEYYLGKPKDSIEIEGSLNTGYTFNEVIQLIKGDKS